MRKTRTPVMLALAGLIASLITFVSSGTAVAAEYIPPTQWSSVAATRYGTGMVTSPTGSVTMPCSYANSAYFNLKTYSATGQLIREIPATPLIDGAPNCIDYPAVDKNDDVYGVPAGYVDGSLKSGPIVAYDGNTKKWQYPTGCTSTYSVPVVGADGNIYFVNSSGRLIGLTPEVEPGTTQPKKVLDVQVQGGGCGKRLYAFKDGLAMEWYYGQKLTYYTYAGVSLGSPSGDYDNDSFRLNAAGRLFYPNFVGSGSTASFTLSAFDPMTKKVAWTAQPSSFGQYEVRFDGTYPTPDGGAVVIADRTKVVAGAPTSEYVIALVKLNAYGLKVWEKELPNQDANGNSFYLDSVQADVSGKIAVLRGGEMQTSDGRLQKAVSIGVFNPDGSVAYAEVMRGNLNREEGNTFGYYSNEFAVGQNTLHLIAEQCYYACSSPDSENKMYPIKVSGLGMDYPRGAVLTVPSPLKPYVALGDSFSSGQGAGVYDTDTVTDTNKCYKSYNGYGRILGRDTSSPLTLTNFAACGGSVADNIDTNTTYPGVTQKQDQALSSDTKVVSLTIGGNDIGFADVVTTCVKASVGLGDCNAAIAVARQKLQGLPTKLNRVYADILSKTSSQNGGANAQIYILGYAPLLSASAPDCMVNDYPFGGENKTAAIQLLSDLNKAISDTVTAINNSRIQYVNPGVRTRRSWVTACARVSRTSTASWDRIRRRASTRMSRDRRHTPICSRSTCWQADCP